MFCRVFNVGDDGNFREEHSGKRTGVSILYLSKPLAALAPELKLSEAELRAKVDGWKKTLLAVRIKRVWPGLDDKILTSWNGLMISSLARGSVFLNEPRYKDAAVKAAEFSLANQRTPDGRWLATHRQGQSKLPAYLDDHAFMALAFLDLFAATKDERWKNEAISIVNILDKHFADPAGGGYFFVADDHEKLLARTKDPQDKAIPSGNGWAAQVLVRLWELTGDEVPAEGMHAARRIPGPDGTRSACQRKSDARRGASSILSARKASRWRRQSRMSRARREVLSAWN